ncbi:hypothetical protein FQN50_006050 [Emmonsiellopsis sp. PD_5]|nr:hypothetical protein FQN50_006050 [Emmonsiellopsis sp. PD_5]
MPKPAWDFLNDVKLAVAELEAEMGLTPPAQPETRGEAAFDIEELGMGLAPSAKKPKTIDIYQNEFPRFTQMHVRLWLFWAGILKQFYIRPMEPGHIDLLKRVDECIKVLQDENSKVWEYTKETSQKYDEYSRRNDLDRGGTEPKEFMRMYEECEFIALGTLLELNAWFIRGFTVGFNHVIKPKIGFIKHKMAPYLDDVDYTRALPGDYPKLTIYREKLEKRWHEVIRYPGKPLSGELQNIFAHRPWQ